MKIEVIGTGCQKCKKLFELTNETVRELEIEASVIYITDINKIITMGIMQSPVVIIDDKPVLAGVLPDKNKLKEIIWQRIN